MPVKSQIPITIPNTRPAMVRIHPMRRPDDDMVVASFSLRSDLSVEVYATGTSVFATVVTNDRAIRVCRRGRTESHLDTPIPRRLLPFQSRRQLHAESD